MQEGTEDTDDVEAAPTMEEASTEKASNTHIEDDEDGNDDDEAAPILKKPAAKRVRTTHRESGFVQMDLPPFPDFGFW